MTGRILSKLQAATVQDTEQRDGGGKKVPTKN